MLVRSRLCIGEVTHACTHSTRERDWIEIGKISGLEPNGIVNDIVGAHVPLSRKSRASEHQGNYALFCQETSLFSLVSWKTS